MAAHFLLSACRRFLTAVQVDPIPPRHRNLSSPSYSALISFRSGVPCALNLRSCGLADQTRL